MAALRRDSGLEPSGRRSTNALQTEEGLAGKHVGPPGQQDGSHDTGTSPSGRQERHPQRYAVPKPGPSHWLRISVRRFGEALAGTARLIAPSHRSKHQVPDSPLAPMAVRYTNRPLPAIGSGEAVAMAGMAGHQTRTRADHDEPRAPAHSRRKEPPGHDHQRPHPMKLDGPS